MSRKPPSLTPGPRPWGSWYRAWTGGVALVAAFVAGACLAGLLWIYSGFEGVLPAAAVGGFVGVTLQSWTAWKVERRRKTRREGER